jgi:hypothetical protein
MVCRQRVNPLYIKIRDDSFTPAEFNRAVEENTSLDGNDVLTVIGIAEYSANNNLVTGSLPARDYKRMMARYGYVILHL